MISIGRNLDRIKRDNDARLSFLKGHRVEFFYDAWMV